MTGPLLLPVLPAKRLRAWPGHERGGAIAYQPPAIAFGTRYAADVHLAAYGVPTIRRRLDHGAPGRIVDGAPLVVAMVVLFFDIDGANHKADPTWRIVEAAKVARVLAAHPNGFFYQTRNGYRLVWRLAVPFLLACADDAARWSALYWRAALYLSRAFGIEPDPACADWTRLFRAPHATRPKPDESPGDAPEDLPTEGDPELRTPWAFEPAEADLAADLAEARRLEAQAPAAKNDKGKTKIAAPWSGAVKALARLAGERDEPTLALPAAPPAPRHQDRPGRPSYEERERLWCERALENMAADLARVSRGGRNAAARDAALILGHYAPHYLNPSAIEAALVRACEANGLIRDDGRDAALATIRKAISDGMRDPKRPELPPDEPKRTIHRDRKPLNMHDQANDQADEQQGPASGPRPANADHDNRPCVLVDFETGERIREAEAALAARDDLNLYVRDGRLVSVQTSTSKRKRAVRDDAGAPLARDLELPALRAMLTDVVRFEALTPEKDDHGKIVRDNGKPRMVRTRCRAHDDIVKGLHKATEWPHLRDLVGIVRAPFLASLDGDVVTHAGYHEESGYLLVTPPGYGAVDVPARPSREQALVALATLKDLLRDFPFAGERDKSAALAALLTLAARPALGAENAPGFVFEANTSSAGKTKLADTLAIIGTGAQSPKQGFTRDEAEMEKTLGSLAGEARALLTFDNITETIGGSKLDLVLTCNGSFSYRLLGFNKTVQSAWRTVLFFTANNPTIGGDIGRRLLVCRLDCQEPEPSKRRGFKYALPRYAQENRAQLAACVLTILRAFCQVQAAERPKVRPMGSFEVWSQLVAGALLWLGEADPLEAVAEERDEGMDPQRMAHVAIVERWNDLAELERSKLRWGPEGISVRSALEALYPHGNVAEGDGMDDLREALEVLAPPAGGKPPTVAKVGYALRHLRGKLTPEGEAMAGGERTKGGKLEGKADRNGVMLWRVVPRKEASKGESRKTQDGKSAGDAGDAGDVSNQSYPAGSKETEATASRGGYGDDPRTGRNHPPQSPASPATPTAELVFTLTLEAVVSLAFQYARAEAERLVMAAPPHPDREVLQKALAAAEARSEAAHAEARVAAEAARATPTPPTSAARPRPAANEATPADPSPEAAAGAEEEWEPLE